MAITATTPDISFQLTAIDDFKRMRSLQRAFQVHFSV
jgi:hypothetical protein